MLRGNRCVGIFVVMMMGFVDLCGEEIEIVFSVGGVGCDCLLMDGFDVEVFVFYDFIVIVLFIYGYGEIFDNGQMLFGVIESGVDFLGKEFVVFVLGDWMYVDMFCVVGENWDCILLVVGVWCFVDLE